MGILDIIEKPTKTEHFPFSKEILLSLEKNHAVVLRGSMGIGKTSFVKSLIGELTNEKVFYYDLRRSHFPHLDHDFSIIENMNNFIHANEHDSKIIILNGLWLVRDKINRRQEMIDIINQHKSASCKFILFNTAEEFAKKEAGITPHHIDKSFFSKKDYLDKICEACDRNEIKYTKNEVEKLLDNEKVFPSWYQIANRAWIADDNNELIISNF